MTNRSVPYRVGDVLLVGALHISSAEVANHLCARANAARLERPGVAPGGGGYVHAGNECPIDLLVGQAVAAIAAPLSREFDVDVRSVGRPKVLAVPVIGEHVDCGATIRYRSAQLRGAFLTFDVELRRENGGGLARFELGLELTERVVRAPRVSPRAQRLNAA